MYIHTQIWYNLMLVTFETTKVAMFTEKLQNGPNLTYFNRQNIYLMICALYTVCFSAPWAKNIALVICTYPK